MPAKGAYSGAAERLRPLDGLGAGAVMVGTVGASFPLLLDLDFDFGAACSAAGATGVSGAFAVPLLRDLDLYFGTAAGATSAGGPGGSNPLLLDLASRADAARFVSIFPASGVGSIFGIVG